MQGLREATENMDDKIKREDVIFDPTEARVEKLIGKEVWAFDRYDGSGKRKSVLKKINASVLLPFACEDDAYTFIAEIKQLSYEERQAQWIKDNGVKVGTKVEILRAAESGEDGWDNVWDVDMSKSIHDITSVAAIRGPYGIRVGRYNYPYFVLEVVKEKVRPYTTKEGECVMGKVVRHKDTKRLYTPASYDQLFGTLTLMYVTPNKITMDALLENFEFADGSPCGVTYE